MSLKLRWIKRKNGDTAFIEGPANEGRWKVSLGQVSKEVANHLFTEANYLHLQKQLGIVCKNCGSNHTVKKGLTAEENKIPSFDQAKEKYFGVIKIKNKSSELLATRAFKGILQFKTIRSLDELNLEFLEAFLQSLIGKYKPSTIKNNIWVINDFLSYCEVLQFRNVFSIYIHYT